MLSLSYCTTQAETHIEMWGNNSYSEICVLSDPKPISHGQMKYWFYWLKLQSCSRYALNVTSFSLLSSYSNKQTFVLKYGHIFFPLLYEIHFIKELAVCGLQDCVCLCLCSGQQITTWDSGLHLKPDCKLQDNVLLVDSISAVTRLEQE